MIRALSEFPCLTNAVNLWGMWLPAPLSSSEQLLAQAPAGTEAGWRSKRGSGKKASCLLELPGRYMAVGTESPAAQTPLSSSESTQLYLQKRLKMLLSPGTWAPMESKSTSEALRKASQ